MQVPEIDAASVVMLGSFNPAIFQPLWLGAQKLIRFDEAENAKITTIQSELADFRTEWFQMQVLQNRFQVTSQDPMQYGPLRDLAVGVFSFLPHTPVTALGMSRGLHFKMRSVDAWHSVGHLLAPKEPWTPIVEAPGLRSMLIQGRRKEFHGGVLHVKVEPSLRVEHGLFVEVNEEFKVTSDKKEPEGALWVPERLTEHWDDILKFAEVVAEHLLNLAKIDG